MLIFALRRYFGNYFFPLVFRFLFIYFSPNSILNFPNIPPPKQCHTNTAPPTSDYLRFGTVIDY